MKFTPISKRLIICFIGAIAIGAVTGWSFGEISTKDALIVIAPIITGFFTLLKGEEE